MAMLATEESRYPAANRRLRLGFVGGGKGGHVGDWHATGARLSNRWDIVAGAMSSDPDKARASAADYRQMAEAEAARADGIEAVVICAPNFLHFDPAAAFMRAGIDVILDKPLTTTIEDALDLVRIRRETGVFLAMTYPYTFHPMVRQARHMVAAGAVGEVRQAETVLRYVVENPEYAAFGTCKSIAQSCKVSVATVDRLAGSLGFSRFADFRDLFRSRRIPIPLTDRLVPIGRS